MLDVNLIRQKPKVVEKGMRNRGLDSSVVGDFLAVDGRWRKLVDEIDGRRNEQKKLAQKKDFKKAGVIKEEIKKREKQLAGVTVERLKILENIPNIPFADVPVGKNAAGNVVLKEVGQKPKFKFPPKDYLSLAESLGIIDVERAAKVAGSRFGYLKGEAALLELALIKFAFDKVVPLGFTPVFPPVLIRPEVLKGMGKVKFIENEEAFFIAKDNLYLVGSSEYTIGALYKDEILREADLPKRYIGFSTCFRREAGSYGKDTKGILRVHQFDKAELFSFCRPEDSEKEHQFLLSVQEKLMKLLKLPYRVVEICTGDMGWADARQYDIETWLAGQQQYRETHSASNTTDFQARGINSRFRRRAGQIEFLHTLNATGLAIGRTIIAIIENYQTAKGTIKMPAVLKNLCFDLNEIQGLGGN